jgi:predicted nuclease of restriction endonuclease-like (RecB) superfamily
MENALTLYAPFIKEIKDLIYRRQYEAMRRVNSELMQLYWEIGAQIDRKQRTEGWGKSVVEVLARELQKEFPGIKGFSARNLWLMRNFYIEFSQKLNLQPLVAEIEDVNLKPLVAEIENENQKPKAADLNNAILPPLVAEISWSKNIIIMQKCKDPLQRVFYIKMTKRFGWTKDVLINNIENRAYEKYLINQTNFDETVPGMYRLQAKLAVKDEYNFDFIEMGTEHSEGNRKLTIATIYSYSANEEDPQDTLPDEQFNNDSLDKTSRDFLEDAIKDYNAAFNMNFDTSADKFQNYYKDLSERMKKREVDLLIVVNMFLTGFDATTLNTLWVDKNLRLHGLIQAYSRTNRILNSVKTFGNIVCFRDLKQATDDAIALFGDKESGGVVLLKTYNDYYNGYDLDGKYQPGYSQRVAEMRDNFPLGEAIEGEEAQKEFIRLYGSILRLRNILTAFDDFAGNEILSERDFQDYQSVYIDLYQKLRPAEKGEKEIINDDIVFELELIKQIEVNIDYILMLVEKYHASNCEDKTVLAAITKAVGSSIQLRSKKELIERFVEQVNVSDKIDDDWQRFVRERKEEELTALIASEKLKDEETRRFIDMSFRDGALKTTGTDLDRILPPVSRFGGGGRDAKKQGVIEKLMGFFEKYLGLV